jgi:hypothetical protein
MPRLAVAMLIVAILTGVIVATITLTRTSGSGSDPSNPQANASGEDNSATPPSNQKVEERHEAVVPVVIIEKNRQRNSEKRADNATQAVIKLAALVPPVLPPLDTVFDFAPGQKIAHDLGSSEPDLADTEMLRIEIETGNPEIRIIWFTPKALDSLEKPATEITTESIQENL